MNSQVRQADTPSHRKAWGWHAIIVAVIGVECAVAAFAHRTDTELQNEFKNGAPADQVEAMFIVSSRDNIDTDYRPQAAELLQSGSPLLREWTMTGQFIHFDEPVAQTAYLRSLPAGPEAFRCRLLLTCRSRQLTNMTVGALAQFLRTD